MYDELLNKLTIKLKAIQGLNKKQITAIVEYILNAESGELDDIAMLIKTIKTTYKKCLFCNNFSSQEKCEICSDSTRENKLMVVENAKTIKQFEVAQIYRGKYFILEALYNPKKPNLLFNKNLEKLLLIATKANEVVLALSPTIEGAITMDYLKKSLRDANNMHNVYQLATGIPLGVNVEYIDSETLKQSFLKKTKF
ncbi:recombination protein RecR [Metamycoplasma arthritidis]|uniref:Recombination protein RecR n=1 Tax=Metamycoplasma arthritidis (strain 158L3-1) TaxID=243272 RepID=B3PM36_META1|nr:toprim domain-containing protein [Metamycoplasma arthritidis]ACF07088.1 recombination protein RecR [Metamycoplasma arthritidis 158L3-1]VEU78616.1 recombination protein RecR [Metamycoplasma arthritidis]